MLYSHSLAIEIMVSISIFLHVWDIVNAHYKLIEEINIHLDRPS